MITNKLGNFKSSIIDFIRSQFEVLIFIKCLWIVYLNSTINFHRKRLNPENPKGYAIV